MSSKKLDKKIQELKITKAYAEFKIMAGDLGPEYDNWIYNIEKTIETLKTKK